MAATDRPPPQAPAPYAQPYPQAPVQESSTALRAISILASRNPTGDFKVDDSRLIIKYSPQWISEGSSQEDKHDRYTNMTFFILSCIAPTIEKLRKDEPKSPHIASYDALKSALSACHIVIVSAGKYEIGPRIDGTKVETFTGRDGDDGVSNSLSPVQNAVIVGPVAAFADAMREGRENGFRRINCTARMNYFTALELAYLVGYMDPDKGMDIRTDAASRDDMLKGEEKRKGLI